MHSDASHSHAPPRTSTNNPQDPAVCPNTIYVAATRALDLLYCVGENHPLDHFPFLNVPKRTELIHAGVIRIENIKPRRVIPEPPMRSLRFSLFQIRDSGVGFQ
jgi:hypothetical protein